MRRNAISALLFAVTVAAVIGCTDSRYKHYYQPKEECVLPPREGEDARFDRPPSAEYRARVKAKEETTLMNSGKMGGGMGGPGGGF